MTESNQIATKILIVDDQEVTRRGLRLILEGMPQFDVVGEAADGYTAVNMAERLAPDLVLLDLFLPGIDGLGAVRLIKEKAPAAKVLILTVHDDEEEVRTALSAGADGYCLKSIFGENLKEAINTVLSGSVWLDPGIADKMLQKFADVQPAQVRSKSLSGIKPATRLKPQFNDGEMGILRGITDGLTNVEIADRLKCSPQFVTDNLRIILRKLQNYELTKSSIDSQAPDRANSSDN